MTRLMAMVWTMRKIQEQYCYLTKFCERKRELCGKGVARKEGEFSNKNVKREHSQNLVKTKD